MWGSMGYSTIEARIHGIGRRPTGPIAFLDRQALMDKNDKPDNTDPILAAEPTDSTEATDPAEPMDRIEPAEPIDRIEPAEPMDKIDPLDPMLRIDPAGRAGRAESRRVPMITFLHHESPGCARIRQPLRRAANRRS
jgi:hypothetical protein